MPSRQSDLMYRMAQTVGVDLDGAFMDGRLTLPGLHAAEDRCTGCAHGKNCAPWMAQTARAKATPEYCRNSAMMAGLKG